ncbi:MAG: OmpA family protein [Luteitalea sp.]|nr:OmpA family protein [Luteitalea sp.]
MRSKRVSLFRGAAEVRRLRPAYGITLVLALAACSPSGQEPSEPVARSSEEPAVKRAEPSTATEAEPKPKNPVKGVDAKPAASALAIEGRNIRLVRVGEDELALQFEFFNGTKDTLRPSDVDIYVLGPKVLLADLPRGTSYGVLPESGNDSRISESSHEPAPPGRSVIVTAMFTAPPAETTKMLVMVAGLLPVIVPVQPQGASALQDDPVLRGPQPERRMLGPLVCRTEGGDGESDQSVVELRLPSDLLFEFGSAKLSAEAQSAISTAGKEISGRSGTVTIEGHTDSVGEDASNQTLSEQRAASVRDGLRAELGDGFSYETVGFGETKPVATNQNPDGSDNPDGRAQNRRVEVRLGTLTPAGPPTLEPAELQNDLVEAGFQVSAESLERRAGYVLARVTVTNPTSAPLELTFGSGLMPSISQAPEGLTLADKTTQRRHSICHAPEAGMYLHYLGNFVGVYEPSDSSVVPGGADVVFWGLYPAPPTEVTSMDLEIGGFGKVVSAQVKATGIP